MNLTFDRETGAVAQGAIRYVVLRPDVLMGVGRALGTMPAFVAAMQESAFQNARASFETYKREGLFEGADPLEATCEFAGSLGWGRWRPTQTEGDLVVLEVTNSPFAIGAGRSGTPVCGVIAGVVRALFTTVWAHRIDVVETACTAQGHHVCKFEIKIDRDSGA